MCSLMFYKISMIEFFATVVLKQCLLALASNIQENATKIPLTKCCIGDKFYAVGFDSCKDEDTSFRPSWPPPVHQYGSNITINVSLNEFHLKIYPELPSCPDGYMAKTWSDFQLYANGTLWIPQEQIVRSPNDFCINPIIPDPDGTKLVARICQPDPCRNGTTCVRKCCPKGMSVHNTDRLCHSSSAQFELVFHDENERTDLSAIYIRDGVTPKCSNGINPLSEEYRDVFYILPTGMLFNPDFPEGEQYTEDYCIENFIDNDKIIWQALTCFPPEKMDLPELLALTIFPYLLLISSIFLIATFLVYASIPEIRNIHGLNVMCHTASLAIMYIGLGVIQLNKSLPGGVCEGLAVVVHFAFLSTFTWLNVMSFDIWWTFRFRVIFSLFILMGVSWMTEAISYMVMGDVYKWFFGDILNILTGFFIFLVFVCKASVIKLIKLKCCGGVMRQRSLLCPSILARSSTRQATFNSSSRNYLSSYKLYQIAHHRNQKDNDQNEQVNTTHETQTTQL